MPSERQDYNWWSDRSTSLQLGQIKEGDVSRLAFEAICEILRLHDLLWKIDIGCQNLASIMNQELGKSKDID